MFHYSFSTVLMTVITSTVLIGIIAVCLQNKKILLSIGYKLLAVLIILALIRFLCPIEVSSVRNIVLPEPLSVTVSYIRHTFFSFKGINLSIWFLLECVWYIGILYKVIRMIISHVRFNRFIIRYGENVTEKEPYASLLACICDSRKNAFRVYRLPNLDAPRQSGALFPCILLPRDLELTRDELFYTFFHEITHYRHHDFLIKMGMSLLSAVYWWNPLCKVLARQLDFLMEVKVDEVVTSREPQIQASYYKSLLNIGKELIPDAAHSKSPVYNAMPKATGSVTDLTKRAQVIFYFKKASVPVFLPLLLLVLAIFIFSYCFTFEAFHVSEQDKLDTYELQYNEMYAILLEDGTYAVYWQGQLIEHVSTLEYFPNVPVVNSK